MSRLDPRHHRPHPRSRPALRALLWGARQLRTIVDSLQRAADGAGGRPRRIGRYRLGVRSTTPCIVGPPHQEDFRGGSSSMCLWRRDEDCLHHYRFPSRRPDSQTPGESGVPRPGPVRAARATAGGRQFLAMIFAAGAFGQSPSQAQTLHVSPSGAPDVIRICWGERIFQRAGY